MFNDSNQKNSIDKDIEKDGLKVDGNILQVLSDIQEVTEEFSSTLLVRDDGSSESTIGRYQGFFKLVTPQARCFAISVHQIFFCPYHRF